MALALSLINCNEQRSTYILIRLPFCASNNDRDTRSFIQVVDSDAEALEALQAAAEADAACASNIAAGYLQFILKADMSAMDDLEQVRRRDGSVSQLRSP